MNAQNMVRTQVLLTDQEKKALSALSLRLGRKQSELIREAIDSFLARFSTEKREDIVDRLAGMWADREDSFTAESLRKEWDRAHSA
jgi:predicted DNA-binding protein